MSRGVTLAGNVIADGGDIYISASGNIVSQNIISNSGAITIISEQGAVTTGYLRSDGYGKGGKIYLQAFGYIRVISSVNIGDTEYSIYTGIDKKGWIRVVHQSSVQKISQKSRFIIGDASFNGTVADVSKPPVLKPQPKPIKPGVRGGLILIIIEIFRQILDAGIADAPTQVDGINPITNELYSGDRERELVKKLTVPQKQTLKRIINSKDPKFERHVPKDLLNKGKVDEKKGCFSAELIGHLGDNPANTAINPAIVQAAARYATKVSGSPNDFLVIDKEGNDAYYDGLLNNTGAAALVVFNAGKPRVIETKYGYAWLNKFIKPETQLPPGFTRSPGLAYNATPQTPLEIRIHRDMVKEINKEAKVAQNCGLSYFLIFSNHQAHLAGQELFSIFVTREIDYFVPIYRIPA